MPDNDSKSMTFEEAFAAKIAAGEVVPEVRILSQWEYLTAYLVSFSDVLLFHGEGQLEKIYNQGELIDSDENKLQDVLNQYASQGWKLFEIWELQDGFHFVLERPHHEYVKALEEVQRRE